jgi:hypothetical protein
VQLQEALEVLGVHPTTPWPEVRIAYRDRIRRLHPDVAGPGSGAHAARTNEAFRVVRAAVAGGAHPAPQPTPVIRPDLRLPDAVEVAVLDEEGLELVAPPDEVFDRLHAALHAVGQVTYVDPGGGLLECLLETEGHPASQLTVSLQGRGATTEAFFTLESLDARAAPPLPAVVRLLAQRLREMPLP